MAPTCSTPFHCMVALAEAGEAPRSDTWLTGAERRQCAALSSAAQQADYRAARLAVRCAVAPSTGAGAAPRSVAVLRRPGAPPAVWLRCPRGGWRRAGVAVSLAHRDGRAAAVAAARGTPIGVDVERAGAVAPEHVRYFAGPAEAEAGPRDPTALWALKEAAWKALRLGPSCPLRALGLEFDAAGQVCAVVVRERRLRARAVLARPWPEHVVAVLLVGAA